MREVEVTRFVAAPPPVVERALAPASVIEYEGSFEVYEVEERDGGWVVTAGGRGLTMRLDFEERDGGLFYRQRGDGGPFDSMATEISVAPEDEGSRVTMRSSVSLGLPVASIADRVAAWKRRGELRRALEALADDL